MVDIPNQANPPAPVPEFTPKGQLLQGFLILCKQYDYIGQLISFMAKLLAMRKPPRKNMLYVLQCMAEQYKEIGEQLKSMGGLIDDKT